MTIVLRTWKRKTCLTIEFVELGGVMHLKIDGCKNIPLSDVLWIES